MSARQRMTMRMYPEINKASADAWGHKGPNSWSAASMIPCYAWVPSGSERHGTDATAERQDLVAMVPLGTSLTSKQRIDRVTDREGTELFGEHYVERVNRKPDHLRVALRRDR